MRAGQEQEPRWESSPAIVSKWIPEVAPNLLDNADCISLDKLGHQDTNEESLEPSAPMCQHGRGVEFVLSLDSCSMSMPNFL
ncbi:hypothetical protein MC885_007239, partial [Smutsia gigantea]